jgi:threonylcarbamoyladenosine tRNA methylthiotransferase MtaB
LSLVVVTGCAAQVDTESFTHVPGVDLVVANSHKGQLESLIRAYYSGTLRDRIYKSNIFKKEDLEPGGGIEAGHTRAFLKIQDGCNSFCTYCVIPFARGNSRSLSAAEIVARINELERAGAREVVLTGVHIADYHEGGRDLEDLLEKILSGTTMPRLRLSSLEPGEVSRRVLELYQNPRLCRHFHMSIQSANSKVLHEMKRQYTAETVERALLAIDERVPGSYVGMDVIAGFPGESDEEFIDSFERLRRLPWTRLHVFPYSARPGTFAARRRDPVHGALIKQRARLLRELSAERLAKRAAEQVGRTKMALSLRGGRWLTRDYWPVTVDGEWPENREFPVEITASAITGELHARRVDATPP